ncbi:MAG: hypothetical protein HYY42_05950, partial [Chloroflexi bacterium]|nr:hypothetical protein [Chloroflexota bacterium]
MGRTRFLSFAVVALALASCQVVPADIAKQITPERTEYKTLEAAYHVLLERHVDRPTSDKLLTSALDGAEAYLTRKTAEVTAPPSVLPGASPAPSPATNPAARGAGCTTLKVGRPQL